MAVELKNVSLLQLLIEKGASVDIADEDGETALILAVLNGFTEGVKLLLDIGHASINHTEKINGATPLIVAGKIIIIIKEDMTEKKREKHKKTN